MVPFLALKVSHLGKALSLEDTGWPVTPVLEPCVYFTSSKHSFHFLVICMRSFLFRTALKKNKNKSSVFSPFRKTLSPRSWGCISHRQNKSQGSLVSLPESLWVLAADFVIKPLGEGSAGFHVCSSPQTIKQKCLSSIKYSCKERVGVIIG